MCACDSHRVYLCVPRASSVDVTECLLLSRDRTGTSHHSLDQFRSAAVGVGETGCVSEGAGGGDGRVA